MDAIAWLGLLGGLALLIVLTMRGVDLLIAAPFCALLVALASGLPMFPQVAGERGPSFTSAYMAGFTGVVASWFFMFLRIPRSRRWSSWSRSSARYWLCSC